MGLKNNILILALLVILILSCKKYNASNTKNIVAFKVENSNNWINSNIVDTSSTKQLSLFFLNNPYRFLSIKHKVLLYFDSTLIYKGNFDEKISVNIPNKYFGKRLVPTMQIFDDSIEYNFIQKTSILFSKDSKFLYLVFCPENDIENSCYLFSQEDEIL